MYNLSKHINYLKIDYNHIERGKHFSSIKRIPSRHRNLFAKFSLKLITSQKNHSYEVRK